MYDSSVYLQNVFAKTSTIANHKQPIIEVSM